MILFTLYILLLSFILPKVDRYLWYDKYFRKVNMWIFKSFDTDVSETHKINQYLGTIITQWRNVFILFILFWITRTSFKDIGVIWLNEVWYYIIPFSILLFWVTYSQFKKMDKKEYLQKIKYVLPITKKERWLFLFVSITAGICEEIIFRGFLLYYLTENGLQLHIVIAVIISSIFFGLIHSYQGKIGMFVTGCLGGCLAVLYIYSGTLIVPIIVHILIDVRFCFIPRKMLESTEEVK